MAPKNGEFCQQALNFQAARFSQLFVKAAGDGDCRALPAKPLQYIEIKGDYLNAFTFPLQSFPISADSCSSKDTFAWICKNHKCPNLHTPGRVPEAMRGFQRGRAEGNIISPFQGSIKIFLLPPLPPTAPSPLTSEGLCVLLLYNGLHLRPIHLLCCGVVLLVLVQHHLHPRVLLIVLPHVIIIIIILQLQPRLTLSCCRAPRGDRTGVTPEQGTPSAALAPREVPWEQLLEEQCSSSHSTWTMNSPWACRATGTDSDSHTQHKARTW